MAKLSSSSSASGRRRQRRGTDDLDVLAEINVTPMVDVMLVLLIIFMVSAPLLTVGIPVDLPKTDARPMTEQKEPLTLSLQKDGSIYVQETLTPKESLIAKLKAVTQHNPDVKLYIRGDAGLSYGVVMEIMGMLSGNGFTQFAFITEPGTSSSPTAIKD